MGSQAMQDGVKTISGFIKDVGGGMGAAATELDRFLEVRASGLSMWEEVAKPDKDGVPTDPLMRLFYEVLMKYEDEAREKILKLIKQGEQNVGAFYDLLHELLGRDSKYAGMLKDRSGLEAGGNLTFEDSLTAGCPVCAVCSACSACVASGYVALGAAGAAGVYLA